MSAPPAWMHVLAMVSLIVAGLCALVVVADETRHPQHMWIMNLVWPIITLWSGPIGLYAYYRVGRKSTREAKRRAKERGEEPPAKRKPFWQSVAVAATHCGSGCTLADVIVEWGVLLVPITLFGSKVAGAWTADFIAAFLIGIVFQYFTIAPMRGLSPGEGIVAAVKADALSLAAWQIGMYGWMAIALFVFFSPETLPKTDPSFWLMMQIAMFAGFATSYPVNWWLLRKGMKEVM